MNLWTFSLYNYNHKTYCIVYNTHYDTSLQVYYIVIKNSKKNNMLCLTMCKMFSKHTYCVVLETQLQETVLDFLLFYIDFFFSSPLLLFFMCMSVLVYPGTLGENRAPALSMCPATQQPLIVRQMTSPARKKIRNSNNVKL